MNERDIDLILALAENRLPAAEVAAAEARIAGNPELAAELATQRAAIAAIVAAPPVSLTAAERTDLHQTLRTELNLEPAVTAAAAQSAASGGWARWLAPLAGGLAVAAVVIGAFVVVPSMGGSDDAAFESAATTMLEDAAADGEETDATAAAGGAETPTTTVAAAAAPRAMSVPRIGADDLAEVDEALRGGSLLSLSAGDTAIAQDEVLACIETLPELAGAGADDVVAVDADAVDVVYLRFVAGGQTVTASVDLATCSLLEISSS